MVDLTLLNTFSSPLCVMYVKEQCPYFVNLSNANIVKLKLLMFTVFD